MTPVETKAEVANETLSAAISRLSSVSVRNVLFATDFSPTSDAALPYATAICRRFGSTLHTVHVLSDAGILMMAGSGAYVDLGTICHNTQNEARERLAQISDRVKGMPCRNYVRHGRVWNNLAAIIEENNINLIVVGTHGRAGFSKLLLGSVAEDILRHAPCPVLTVGPKVSGRAKLPMLQSHGRDLAPPELELRQILFATNFGNNTERLAHEAILLADEFHARLILMHVIDDYDRLGSDLGPIEEATQKLKELIPVNAELQLAPETVIEFGNVPERILKITAEREADMIILGARSSAEVGTTHLPWASAYHVIAEAHCPVLTISE
jgi:nucleotide-binding universal stress UspA family protein